MFGDGAPHPLDGLAGNLSRRSGLPIRPARQDHAEVPHGLPAVDGLESGHEPVTGGRVGRHDVAMVESEGGLHFLRERDERTGVELG